MNRYRLLIPMLLAAAIVTACGASAGGPSVSPSPVVLDPTLAPAAVATPLPAPTGNAGTAPTDVPAATAASMATEQSPASADDGGITDEGYHYLGRADAPATIVMYSDVF